MARPDKKLDQLAQQVIDLLTAILILILVGAAVLTAGPRVH